MNKLTYLVIYFYLTFQVLCIIPEWNLSQAGEDLLGDSNETKYIINHRYLFNVELKMEKEIKRNSTTGEITTENYVTIGNQRKKVDFEQIDSYYRLYNTYIICPKGNFHPYDFNEGKNFIPDGFEGQKWDLNCYKKEDGQISYLLVFYFMNGSYKNAYLTSTKDIKWYSGVSINNVEIYDYLLRGSGDNFVYQMIGLLKNDSNMELRYLKATLQEGAHNQHIRPQNEFKTIIKTENYTQATFKNISVDDNNEYFYYFTYNNISDFTTGFSKNSINKKSDYPSELQNIQITKNNYSYFEFFNDMEIEEMNFLLDNKFLYYKMKDQKEGTSYYGMFDIVSNKIIFNTKENITKFIPHTDGAMLAITNKTAYKICAYTNNNACTDTCSDNNYLLDIDGNKCGSSCPSGKYLFNPSGVCINQCDQSLYILEGNTCELCKDKNNSTPYKLVNGTDCLSEIPEGAEYYNEKLKLLKCRDGYHLENNTCMQNCYELCLTCSEKSTDEGNQKCTNCRKGFNLDSNNNCQCPLGEEKKNKTCEKCSSKCGTFKLNSCDCLSCNSSYYLINNTCEKCAENCTTCETEATKCTGCNSSFFLDNYKCHDCPSNCKEQDSPSCKCKSCDDGLYLDAFYCKNCSSNCKNCNNAEKCNECFNGFYKKDDSCHQCDENCETCDGGKEGDSNYHCLSCNKAKANKYLIKENNMNICVENCSQYNMTTDSEKFICLNPNNTPEKDVDYMLWIFVAIIGIILILISIFICKKICAKNNDIESIDEVEGELIEQ